MQQGHAVRVAPAHEIHRSARELDGTRSGTQLARELRRPRAESGEVDLRELGRLRDGVPQRERAFEMRPCLCEAEDGLRLAGRIDGGGERLRAATRCRPVRCELRRSCRSTACEHLGKPRMELFALAGEDRRVDGLREQGVAEAEAARRRLGDENAVLHRPAQRLAQVALRQARRVPEQRVPDVTPGRGGQAQHILGRLVDAGEALQEQIAQATRELCALLARRREELLHEEGISLRAGHDRVCQGHRQGVAVSRQERRQVVVLERSEFDHVRGARAADPVLEPPHARGRRGLVRAVGREQQNRPVMEVVRKEDDEIERGRVGPVQILEHQQHGCRDATLREQRQRLLEHLQLRAGRVDRPALGERAQRLDERLIRKLRADEIDRAPDEDVEPGIAGTARELGGEPGLADARLPDDENGRAAPGARRVERALELLELTYPSHEHLARATHLPASIAQLAGPR